MRLYGRVEKVMAIQVDDNDPKKCSNHCFFKSTGYNLGYYFGQFCSLFFHIYKDDEYMRCPKCLQIFGLEQDEEIINNMFFKKIVAS